ncbi:MAG: peptidase [Herbinix sp.]|nr:peptidase [Herbinix sp.]
MKNMTKTIMLEEEKIYKGNLILVNANHPLRSFQEEGFIPADIRFPKILVKSDAANILQLILKKISCYDEILPVSGYRSVTEQRKIYADSLRDNGEDFTRKYVALPNHSEHQTGLAIDLGIKKEVIDFIRPEFPYDGISQRFRKTALRYGFVERYQSTKEQITGIAHEPWHFRYVGYPHSEIMNTNNLSLEEYIDFLKDYKYGKKHFQAEIHGKQIEVFYVSADESKTTISVPEQTLCQVSGNNVDGFIITLWRNRNE